MSNFDDFEDDDTMMAKEALKEMLVSEIEIIRDTLSIVNMFFGENLKAGFKMLQELEPNKINDNNEQTSEP